MISNINILYIGSLINYLHLDDFENWSITALGNSIEATKHLETTNHVDAIICDYYLTRQHWIFLC